MPHIAVGVQLDTVSTRRNAWMISCSLELKSPSCPKISFGEGIHDSHFTDGAIRAAFVSHVHQLTPD